MHVEQRKENNGASCARRKNFCMSFHGEPKHTEVLSVRSASTHPVKLVGPGYWSHQMQGRKNAANFVQLVVYGG
eukprot:1899140-Karenia_brevis.AAC.1